jgi:hypothetical protein
MVNTPLFADARPPSSKEHFGLANSDLATSSICLRGFEKNYEYIQQDAIHTAKAPRR